MSKNKISLRETIAIKALEMYNAYGVEYVGVRELAKELNIKGGNITYYFPTKNDLLQELAQRLTLSNTEILNQQKTPGLYHFMDMSRQLYFNQYKYRAFFLSLPLWIRQDIDFAKRYQLNQATRKESFMQELQTLINDQYLRPLSAQELDAVLGTLVGTGRLWISEAIIDGLIDDEEKAVHTYLRRLAGLLHLIAIEKGEADLDVFIKELK